MWPRGEILGANLFAGLLDNLYRTRSKSSSARNLTRKTMGLLDQAHSFAQGASNGVAGSLTGPVDGLAWLLRKAGVPVPQAPLGGSDWMRSVGLMQEPKERMAGLLGEGIGSALPTVIAGKAPQIAGGLLQMERNAMAPRTLNPQTGAIVWHGSPHKFDKFDSSKIGTGEGAQAYGHGLYLADNPTVAKNYQAKVSAMQGSGEPTIAGRAINWDSPQEAAAFEISRHNGDRSAAADFYARTFNNKKTEDLIRSGNDLPSVDLPGQLYKVDLPDEHIAKMLDWDKPLSQQHPDVQKALGGIEAKFPEIPDFNLRKWMDADPLASTWHNVLQRDLGADPAMITGTLKDRGIPGIRYLDGGSRGAGAGSSNYVVFPGNEGLLQILERNGQGLLGN